MLNAQELEHVWRFYRDQSEQCASELSCLQDTSAARRHQLHKSLGTVMSTGADDSEENDHVLLDIDFPAAGSVNSKVMVAAFLLLLRPVAKCARIFPGSFWCARE